MVVVTAEKSRVYKKVCGDAAFQCYSGAKLYVKNTTTVVGGVTNLALIHA